ncbi:g265 [Coccomyxa viridis]|uniref:G265 protein n=1 Tax=Coccomyxa viridis TaxID=1274662 RepID=A0ABP1FKL9_9CHLO
MPAEYYVRADPTLSQALLGYGSSRTILALSRCNRGLVFQTSYFQLIQEIENQASRVCVYSVSMGNPFILYNDEEKSPVASRCPYRGNREYEEALRLGHHRSRSSRAHPGSDLPLRASAGRHFSNDSRRMVETFVEVVRRGIENRDELSVTYTVPSRSDEDGEQGDRDSEDLPDDLPDLIPPVFDDDSEDEVEEEDLIQEYGLLPEPMDTSSDDPSHMSISQQVAFERQAITDNPEWALQRRRSRATAERSRASLADQSARAAHAEMLTLLRREWDRARAGSAQARAAGGAAQPENLTSVRRVAREVLAQLDSRIESLTARQRERQPAVERPRVPVPFLSEVGLAGEGTTFAAVDIPALLSNARARHASTGTDIDPFLTYEEVRERGRSLLAENAPRSSPFLSRRSMLRGNDAGQSSTQPSTSGGAADIFSRTSGAAQLL